MEWIERMNGVLNYIEENLSGEIDQSKAAQIAACSEFHFPQ